MADSTDKNGAHVVVHYKAGRLLKGYTHDFRPGESTFTLVSEQRRDKGQTYLVKVGDLKAVFFVRSLNGNMFYREKKKFAEVNMSHLRGIGIRLHFKDGEVIRGSSLDYAVGKIRDAVAKLRELSPLWDMYKDGIDLDSVKWAAH